MVVAYDLELEPEPERSAGLWIDIKLRYSAASMMLCDDDVVPVNFIDIRKMWARQ